MESATRWPETLPRQVRAAGCVLRAPSAATRRCDTRAEHALRDSNGLIKTLQPPAAVRSRCWCGRTLTDIVGMERAARWLTTHPRQVHAAWPVFRVRRPLLHGAIRAREARHGIRTPWSMHVKPPAAVGSRCLCGHASADGVGRSASRVGPHHNQGPSPRCAARAPRAVGPFSTG